MSEMSEAIRSGRPNVVKTRTASRVKRFDTPVTSSSFCLGEPKREPSRANGSKPAWAIFRIPSDDFDSVRARLSLSVRCCEATVKIVPSVGFGYDQHFWNRPDWGFP